jgi:hypothetical protein
MSERARVERLQRGIEMEGGGREMQRERERGGGGELVPVI